MLGSLLVLTAALIVASVEPRDAEDSTLANGPLRVHPQNRRYFMDGRGQVVYLAGSHNWTTVQDHGFPLPVAFNFEEYVDFLTKHHHNFVRLWTWEHADGAPWTTAGVRVSPLAFDRAGPGLAADGKPRFDVTRFDSQYFDRLRRRVVRAGEAGLYVSVMLFQGWSVDSKEEAGNPWPGHPFHRRNNVNGIDGDVDGDGQGAETHTLTEPRITALQQAYVKNVLEALNDLDNVLWEISNESHVGSTAWQYEMIRFIKRYEATLGKQHPIGMTAQYPRGTNRALFESPADWVSPVHSRQEPYKSDPPPGRGDKIVISDTDHLWGVGGDRKWVWKSFTRGLHPIYMDPLGQKGSDPVDAPSVRRALGDTVRWSRRLNLVRMTPRPDLASSRFCLADVGAEYLVYVPTTRSVIVDLSDVNGQVAAEWFDAATGKTADGGVRRGGRSRFFTAPFVGDVVLYLRALPQTR